MLLEHTRTETLSTNGCRSHSRLGHSVSASHHQTKLSLLPPHLKELEGSLGTVSEVSKAVEVGFAVVPLEHTTLSVKLDAINFISALVGQGNEGLGGIFGDSGWWVELHYLTGVYTT